MINKIQLDKIVIGGATPYVKQLIKVKCKECGEVFMHDNVYGYNDHSCKNAELEVVTNA